MKIQPPKFRRLLPSLLLAASFAVQAQLPTIYNQPQGQTGNVGGNVTLSVLAYGPGSGSPSLPSVVSGNLRLWLRADTGVVTNSQGHVTQWEDQSGNTNDAFQSDVAQQPLLETAIPGLNGGSSIRFNGVQDNVNGDFLESQSDLGVPDAMSTFVVYNAFATTNFENMIWMVGTPASSYGQDRCDYISSGDIGFSTWAYVYIPPYITPTNTYRIKSDRIDTNFNAVEMSDIVGAETVTNFTETLTGTVSPSPGYSVGGLNVNDGAFVASNRALDGDVAEFLVYRGYLSDSDRNAVDLYLAQKYFGVGSSGGLTYQWQLNGSPISGATNATLTLSDVQTNQSGTYSVIVTDSSGPITSSNAVVNVAIPPYIVSQATNEDVVQGASASFSVVAGGTAPLSYQWFHGSQPISGATSDSLTLSNVQSTDAGIYYAKVTSPYGLVTSSNTALTIELAPTITLQPQGQAVSVGSALTLSVSTVGLPSVSSGQLQLWLSADSGVVADANGNVSAWKDKSGNGNDATQESTNHQPSLVTGISGLSGYPAIRFNGIQNAISRSNVDGSMLHGVGDVGTPDAMTSFVVYNAFAVNYENVLYLTGDSGTSFGVDRVCYISSGDMAFSSWGYVYLTPFTVPLNTYRIRTDRIDTNGDSIELFDETATTSTNYSLELGGMSPPAPGYDIGGVNPDLGSTAHNRTFNGDIAEVIIYRGQLTDPDREAISGYLAQKYYEGVINSSNNLTYQWQFDGTNIDGATNATLTVTNVQSANAGDYRVFVGNSFAVTTSSNAVVTVGDAPSFTAAPQNATVAPGASVTFSATVSGSAPIFLQWSLDGVAIPGATNLSYSVSTVTTNSDGLYSLTAANSFGSTTASAQLTVLATTLRLGSSSSSGGSTVTVPVQLIATGQEAALGFSLNFNPVDLTLVSAELGSNALGSLLLVNSNQLSAGELGLAVDFSSAPAAGTNDIIDLTFRTAVLTNGTTAPIIFGGQPTGEEVTDGLGNPLAAIYQSASTAISPAILEGDVWPTPNGDGQVTISDWVEEGRLVAGLDSTTNASLATRADCAPRDTGGDGQLTVADWVQVGRYAAGLDPLTAVGFVPSQNSVRPAPSKTAAPRSIAIVPLSQGGLTNTVAVQFAAQGNENSLGFSVSFDPTAVRFVKSTIGSGAVGAVVYQNVSQAAAGRLGFVLGYNLQGAPTAFGAGLQPVILLTFASVSYSNSVAINFNNSPVVCGLADISAGSIPANFQNGRLPIGGSTWPSLGFNNDGKQLSISWPISSAAGFTLESATSLSGPWTPVNSALSTNGNAVNFSATPGGAQTFFRLQHN